MGTSIRLGRILGIPLGLNYSWFLVFILVTFFIAHHFSMEYSHWPPQLRWALAIVTSLLFFASVLAHELAHSVVAVRRGIPVKGITLFVFGGVAQLSREAHKPSAELAMAVVGPIASLFLGGFFWGLAIVLNPYSEHLAAVAAILGPINIALGLFNLVPGFPLDGGRVFRALLWGATGNYHLSTRVAAFTGQGIAFLLIASGIIIAIRGDLVQGIWLAFIGWFLETAASASYRQLRLMEALRGFTARDLMGGDYPTAPANITLTQLVDSYILPTGRRLFVISRADQALGIVTLKAVKEVPRERWPVTTVDTVMVPLERAIAVSPEEDAHRVLEIMDESDVNQLLVIEGNRLIGLIGRDSIIRFIRTRAELGI
jgi:Zn-dependent protease